MKIWGDQKDLDLLLVNAPLSDYSKPHPEYTVFQPPIGLSTLASYLGRRGFKVAVWDDDTDKVSPQGIVEGILGIKPRWVGFNTFTSGFEILDDILERINHVSPETKVMLGGIHATVAGEVFLNTDRPNQIIVRSDGELKVEALLNRNNLADIPGISYIFGNEVRINKENDQWLVQEIDNPLFSLDRRFVPYDPTLGNLSPDGKRRAFIASSRGCPYECTYCSSSRLARENTAVRFRSPQSVVNEVKEIISTGVLDIKFNDELVWASEGRIKQILGGVLQMGFGREMGLQIRGNGRANIIANCSDETISLMADAGVRRVGFGVEQGTKEGMSKLKKHLTPEEVINATSRLAEKGIPALANFMFNIPGEDEREEKATVALAKELIYIGRKYDVPIEIDGYPYRPYPGTEMYENLIRVGYKKEDLTKVVQTEGVTGGGSHLQVEPYVHLSAVSLEREREHRYMFDSLTEMSNEELHKLDNKYNVSICLERNRTLGAERGE